MPLSSRCSRCGLELPESPPGSLPEPLCSACANQISPDPSPWWVEAAQREQPVAAVPPPLPAVPPPLPAPPKTDSRRRRWLLAATALAGCFLVFAFLSRADRPKAADEASTAKQDRKDSLTPQRASSPPMLVVAESVPPAPSAMVPPNGKPATRTEEDVLASAAPPPLSASPPPSAHPAAPPKPRPTSLHHLQTATEEELRRQAATAPEISLNGAGPAILNAYRVNVPANQVVLANPNLTDFTSLLEVRPDLRMLPLRFGDACKLNRRLTAHLDVLSRKLRAYLDQFTPETDGVRDGSTEKLREALLTDKAGKKPVWLREEAVPPLLQILMGEETPFRLILVEVLSKIRAPAATVALAQRAAFDLSPEVREQAVAALRDRPAAEWRGVLVKALRYPWAVPAQHAAETLVRLKDTGAVPPLVSLLRQPDPAGPLTLRNNRHILQDVVRLNHLNNCLMCHPPAATAQEPVLGVDPVVPLPVALQTPAMVNVTQQVMSSHSHGSSTVQQTVSVPGTATVVAQLPLLIRGDITFLRQDFTVRQPVAVVDVRRTGNRVRRQRFDYVLRTRLLSRAQFTRLEELTANRSTYPQRDAVLFALRELTGKDAGPTTEAWLQLFPRAETDVAAARLSAKVLKSDGLDRERLLAKCREGEGEVYTQALACVIAGLRGGPKERVRNLMVDRLARLSATELGSKLRDEDAEVRRAAMLACTHKERKDVVPELIEMLGSAEPVTVRLAEEGLANLTGEHLKHPLAWKDWWKKHGEARPTK